MRGGTCPTCRATHAGGSGGLNAWPPGGSRWPHPGPPAGAAAEIPSGPHADLGAQAAAKPRLSGRGIGWLIAAAAAFTLALFLFDSLRIPLFWDESVYASQISQHVPMPWGAERARGLPLLVAPVALFTSSVVALRVYLVVMAGIGLFLAMLAWRGWSPDWVVALAGVIFGGLWVTQQQASLLLPSYWSAIGGLAGVGLFLRAMSEADRRRWVLSSWPPRRHSPRSYARPMPSLSSE